MLTAVPNHILIFAALDFFEVDHLLGVLRCASLVS